MQLVKGENWSLLKYTFKHDEHEQSLGFVLCNDGPGY